MSDEIRLPTDHGDENEWGEILLNFLRVAHEDNGKHKFPISGNSLPVVLEPLPNGDGSYTFDGVDDYLEAADATNHSIVTTRQFTVEAWISPSVLEFPNHAPDKDFVHWIGKGEENKHEWTMRMYSLTTPNESPQRPNRTSAYAFPNDGAFGQGTYFQQAIVPGRWIHVVATYHMDEPGGGLTDFPGSPRAYPGDFGRIRMYRDGILINESHFGNYHGEHDDVDDADHDAEYIAANDYLINPANNTAPVRLGSRDGYTMSGYFAGRMAKVAIYSRELTVEEILDHYEAMTPGGNYDSVVLADTPVTFWTLNGAGDLTDKAGTNHLSVGTALEPGPIETFDIAITSFTIREDGNALFEGSLTTHSNLSVSGMVYYGGDIRTRMYRTADGRLKTDADFVSQRSITTYDGDISAGGALNSQQAIEVNGEEAGWAVARFYNNAADGSGILLRLNPAALGTAYALWVGGVGEGKPRFLLRSDGRMFWGDGGSAEVDTNLYRSGPDQLRTDDRLVVNQFGIRDTFGSAVGGTSTSKFRVYDENGNVIGYVPIYPS